MTTKKKGRPRKEVPDPTKLKNRHIGFIDNELWARFRAWCEINQMSNPEGFRYAVELAMNEGSEKEE